MSSLEQLSLDDKNLLDFYLKGEHPTLEVLRNQLSHIAGVRREYSGVGVFTYFEFDEENGGPDLDGDPNFQIGDVGIENLPRNCPVDTILFIRDGRLAWLEYVTMVDRTWPCDFLITRMYYFVDSPLHGSQVPSEERDLDNIWQPGQSPLPK